MVAKIYPTTNFSEMVAFGYTAYDRPSVISFPSGLSKEVTAWVILFSHSNQSHLLKPSTPEFD